MSIDENRKRKRIDNVRDAIRQVEAKKRTRYTRADTLHPLYELKTCPTESLHEYFEHIKSLELGKEEVNVLLSDVQQLLLDVSKRSALACQLKYTSFCMIL